MREIDFSIVLLERGCSLTGTGESGKSADFQQKLASLREDPQVKRLARKHAGSQDLADDALNEAFCAVARVQNPDSIEDLRAYYCRVVVRMAQRLRYQLAPTPVEDIDQVAAANQDKPGCGASPAPSLEAMVSTRLLVRTWRARLDRQRAELTSSVAGRSSDRDLYRETIVTTAEKLIDAVAAGDHVDVMSSAALREAYPDWFDQPGCPDNTLDQRAARARADVAKLLRSIIGRADLYP